MIEFKLLKLNCLCEENFIKFQSLNSIKEKKDGDSSGEKEKEPENIEENEENQYIDSMIQKLVYR